MVQLPEVIARLKQSRKVAILTHLRPDPDALGAQAAAAHILTAMGATEIHRILFSDMQGPYRFLMDNTPGKVVVWSDAWAKTPPELDTILAVDTCTYQQLEPARTFLKTHQDKVVALDHHLSRDEMGPLLYTDVDAAACVEILWEVAVQAGMTMDAALALPLMAGLVGDTGWFRFDSVRPRTHRMAADLVRFVNPAWLYEHLMQNETRPKLGLMQRALASLRWSCDDRFACMMLGQTDFKETGAVQAQTEYLVDMPMVIGTVEVVALLTETPDGRIRASMRSKHDVDVNKLANRFAGGGHAKASGCRFEGPMEAAYAKLEAAMEEALAALKARAD
jgi:bifunctional oligoribonuclease and PAP phosphatase NrnA